MKFSKVVSSSLAVALCALVPLSSAFAEHLDWTQRGELFLRGTVTDNQNKTWDVILVPGVDNVTQGAKDGWTASGAALGSMKKKGFWRGLGQDFKDGFRFSKDVVTHQWVGGIKGDAQEAVEQNKSITPGEIGSGLEHFASWAWFVIKAVSRTAWMPVGVAGGVAYSVTAPVVVVAEKSVVEGVIIDAAARGAIVPGVLYVWNGIAWAATSVGNVPTQPSFFVHLQDQDSGNPTGAPLVIDQQGFETLVKASTLQAMNDDQKAQLQTKIDAINAEIKKTIQPLQQQEQGLEDQAVQGNQKLQNDSAEQALENMLNQAMNSSQVTMSSDAKDAYLDQAKLREVVTAYLKSLGVDSPQPAMIDSIVQRITQSLEQMRVEMAKTPSDSAAQNSLK